MTRKILAKQPMNIDDVCRAARVNVDDAKLVAIMDPKPSQDAVERL